MMEDSLTFFILPLIHLVRFALIVGIPFLIFYILMPEKFTSQKIQKRMSKKRDWIRELVHSAQSIGVFILIATLVIFTPLREYTQIYKEVDVLPRWWLPLSIVLALVIHDTYFYWMHRTIHHPKLFKLIHLVHHQSTNPTPLASHSFNLSESFLEALVAPLILIVLPMHLYALWAYVMIALIFNVYGHLGYEIAPRLSLIHI